MIFRTKNKVISKTKKNGVYCHSHGLRFIRIFLRIKSWHISAIKKQLPINTRPVVIDIPPPALHLFKC